MLKKIGILITCLVVGFLIFFKVIPSYISNRITSSFSSETYKNEFISYMTQVKGVSRFQVAELDQIEILTQQSRKKVLWNRLELPPIVVSLQVPVHYVYTVDLKKDWVFTMDENTLRVIVPDIEFNPPAADVSAMKFKVQKASLFRNEEALKSSLQRKLSPYLNERAKEQVSLVKETARRQIRESIESWVTSKLEEAEAVNIVFASEAQEKLNAR